MTSLRFAATFESEPSRQIGLTLYTIHPKVQMENSFFYAEIIIEQVGRHLSEQRRFKSGRSFSRLTSICMLRKSISLLVIGSLARGQYWYYPVTYYSVPVVVYTQQVVTYATTYYTPVYVVPVVASYVYTVPAAVRYIGVYSGSSILEFAFMSNESQTAANGLAWTFVSKLAADISASNDGGDVSQEGMAFLSAIPAFKVDLVQTGTAATAPVVPPPNGTPNTAAVFLASVVAAVVCAGAVGALAFLVVSRWRSRARVDAVVVRTVVPAMDVEGYPQLRLAGWPAATSPTPISDASPGRSVA